MRKLILLIGVITMIFIMGCTSTPVKSGKSLYAPVPTYDKEVKRVKPGMTPSQVEAYMGHPVKVVKSNCMYAHTELWVYPQSRLFFRDGILKGIY